MITPAHRALARLLKRQTQSQVAKAAGVSAQHVSDVRACRRNIRDKLLDHLGYERVTVIRRKREPA